MTLKFLVSAFLISARGKPKGYQEEVMRNSRRVGSYRVMSRDAYLAIQQKYSVGVASVEAKDLPAILSQDRSPSWTDMIRSAAEEMTKWTAAGFPLCSPSQLQARAEVCTSCTHWDSAMWGGAGGCKICRCTKLKLYMATTTCPDKPPKWRAIE